MEKQVSMKRDLGPQKEGVEYIEFIDDLKKESSLFPRY